MENKTNAWLQTASGKALTLLDPKPEQIELYDVAHGLSNVCRFSGQCKIFYSVAQHSVLASHVITLLDGFLKLSAAERKALQLIALMHDSSEAFIADVPTPIKVHLPFYKEVETKIMQAIATRFGLDFALFSHPLVHEVDAVMLATEKRDIMQPEPQPWIDLPKPFGGSIFPMDPKKAESDFLVTFLELGGKA